MDIRNKIISEIDSKTIGNLSQDEQYLDEFLNVNAINLDLSEDLYRIFNWNYFIEDFRDRKLTLSRTDTWKDPFENFILKSKVLYNGRYGKISDTFFGSCWSLKSECDGLWKNFRPNNRSCVVKVKVNAKKLFSSIYDINDLSHDRNYFIGKVRYLSEKSIANLFKRTYNLRDLDDGMLFVQQLLIKRIQFNYEQEVRVLLRKDIPFDKIRIPIDPNILFEEIVLDPFISLSSFRRKKKEIENVGYTGLIKRSKLYNKPFFVFKIR